MNLPALKAKLDPQNFHIPQEAEKVQDIDERWKF
jgi:hypothetical protein